jgi:hypothetical protein
VTRGCRCAFFLLSQLSSPETETLLGSCGASRESRSDIDIVRAMPLKASSLAIGPSGIKKEITLRMPGGPSDMLRDRLRRGLREEGRLETLRSMCAGGSAVRRVMCGASGVGGG